MTKDTQRFTLRLPASLKHQIEAYSKKIGVSFNAMVVQILWAYVNEHGRR